MIRRIAWVSQHLEIDTLNGKLKEEDPKPAYDDDDDDCDKIENVISTPFGIWRVNDALNPYRQFKLWMGHTNFTIDNDVANVIKHIPGVEILNILTRYRFMIGVGDLFNIRDTRVQIEQELNCNNNELSSIVDEELKKEVEDLKEELSTKYDKWALYVMPNGSISHTSNKDKDFAEQLSLYRGAVDHSSGILIESPE